MQNISKRLIVAIIVLIIAIVVGGWFWYASVREKQAQMGQKQTEVVLQQQINTNIQSTDTVVDILDYINDSTHWNTIKTEFFSVQFPRTWSWVSPDKDPFPYGLITNNVRVASKWFMASDNVNVTKNEVTILINPGLTTQPLDEKKTEKEVIGESFDGRISENRNKGATCKVLQEKVPSILQCTYEVQDELVHSEYYIANKKNSVNLSVYANTANVRLNDIVNEIVHSVIIPQ